jgi:hypothetical protein
MISDSIKLYEVLKEISFVLREHKDILAQILEIISKKGDNDAHTPK